LAQLKILHLSHESLPDWRIEKSAISALKNNHEVVFAGMPTPKNYNNRTFSAIYNMVWTAKARFGIPFYWRSVKKQLEKIMRRARPDIVHAHNLFSAKMISEFDMPFVYDDHEYWPFQARLLKEMANQPALDKEAVQSVLDLSKRIRRKFINNYAVHLWTNWEREVVSSAPTITVSDKLAESLRLTCNSNKVFLVPNFPMTFETENLPKPNLQPTLSCVYAGSDGLNKQKQPNRNIDGITDTFINGNIGELTIIGWEGRCSSKKITYAGHLSRRAMFLEMSKHSIGLLPWKKHWSHGFVSPNKAYEYAHAGLFVGCTSSFETVLNTLKDNCASFEDYNDLVSQLEYFRDNLDEFYKKRLKIFEFARNNLIWERYENNIFNAYQVC
jgi:hypothetical protein